jgi:hypothetical protein
VVTLGGNPKKGPEISVSTENGNAEDVAERKPPKLVEWRSPGNCAIEVDGELQVVSVAEAEKILAEGGSP